MSTYANEFRRSIEQPEAFWAEQARRIPRFKAPTQILHYDEANHARWFPDGELNICHAALDHHLEPATASHPATSWHSPATDTKPTLTYRHTRNPSASTAAPPT